MAKVKLNVLVDESIADRFREQVAHFDNRIGDCLAAAMLQWLATDPQEQATLLKTLHDAQVDEGAVSLSEEALRRQSKSVRKRSKQPKRSI